MVSDVIIVGGGVIGLSAARELHRAGLRRIKVIERSACGKEASWAAAGMLGPQAEADAGGRFFELCSVSRDLYPSFAGELGDETGIDVELDRSGTLYASFCDADSQILAERAAWQRLAGLDVEHLSSTETRKAEPFVSPDVCGSLYFPGDWQVENRKLLAALIAYSEANGIDIIERTHVNRVVTEDGVAIGVETDDGIITTGHVILATGAWSSLVKLGVDEMPFSVEPVLGRIVSFRTAKRLFQRVIYSTKGYLVPRADGRILAGSTTEHNGFEKAGSDSAVRGLQEMAFEIAPGLGGLSMMDNWCGLRPASTDGLPILGTVGGIVGLTVLTAHYRNGILLAPITAQIAADRILNGNDHWAFTEFSAARFSTSATVV